MGRNRVQYNTETELLKLHTFNCRGLREGSKRRSILAWLKKYYNGIILLQETHTTHEIEQQWIKDWKGQAYFCHGKSTSRGVAILISPNLDIEIQNIIRDKNGRFLLLDTTFQNESLIIANVYVPTKDKKQEQLDFLDFLHTTLAEFSDSNILVGGDFNICLFPHMDKKVALKEISLLVCINY